MMRVDIFKNKPVGFSLEVDAKSCGRDGRGGLLIAAIVWSTSVTVLGIF